MITVGKITLPCIIDIIIIIMTKRRFLVYLHKSDGHLKNPISDIIVIGISNICYIFYERSVYG